MTGFVIHPIGRDITTQVRTTLRAPDYGHVVQREVARGTGPCRECLSAFRVGEDERLLFTFNPFSGSTHLPQPGPVFIHAGECEPPRGNEYPDGLRGIPVLAEAHHVDGTTSAPRPLVPGAEAGLFSEWLETPEVSFLHLRHAEAGCYIARVDREAR